jgi:hypothetical protein
VTNYRRNIIASRSYFFTANLAESRLRLRVRNWLYSSFREADAAGARPVGNPPHRTALLECPIRHEKQRRERLGRQTLDAKVPHDRVLLIRDGRYMGRDCA